MQQTATSLFRFTNHFPFIQIQNPNLGVGDNSDFRFQICKIRKCYECKKTLKKCHPAAAHSKCSKAFKNDEFFLSSFCTLLVLKGNGRETGTGTGEYSE